MSSQCQQWTNQLTSLKDDCCQLDVKNNANKTYSDYVLNPPYSCNINPNFLCQTGLNQQMPTLLCDDATLESQMRNGKEGNLLTHTKARKTLNVRSYKTVPFMGECRAPLMDTDTYSMLLSGESTRTLKSCGVQARLERWEPQVPCIAKNIQNPRHYIPEYWVRGGQSTSAYYRNIDYLKACGFTKCESSCQKLFCPDVDVPERIKRQKMQGRNLPCMPTI